VDHFSHPLGEEKFENWRSGRSADKSISDGYAFSKNDANDDQ